MSESGFDRAVVRQLLADSLERFPEASAGEPDGAEIETAREVLRLARQWPAPVEGPVREALEALARKVAVAKRVDAAYKSDWKKLTGARPAPVEVVALLAAVFFAYGHADSTDEQAQGLAWKFFNAGLMTLDLPAGGTEASVPGGVDQVVDKMLAGPYREGSE